jgi:carbamoyl-phosphate synthase large subunit
MSRRLTILMTCGAGPGAVGHIDAARRNSHASVRVVVGDVSADQNVGFALADDTVQIPPATDPDLGETLRAICRQHDVDVLWPVFDGELEPLSAVRDRFEAEGVRLLLADAATIRLCLDKAAFHQRLAETGWVLPSRVVRSADELKAAAETLGYPDRPVVVRPVRGTGGRGVHVIEAAPAAREAFFTAKADSTVCDLATAAAAVDGCVPCGPGGLLVTPFIAGGEYGCDVLAEGGEILAAVTRQKLPPVREGMHTRIVVEEDADVLSIVADVLGAIRADGLLSVDLRKDDQGRLRVLEINPRAGAYLGMACARIDLLGLALAKLLDESVEVAAFRRSSERIMGLRYWADLVQVDGQSRPLGWAGSSTEDRVSALDGAGGDGA